jgi:hypothetical protein
MCDGVLLEGVAIKPLAATIPVNGVLHIHFDDPSFTKYTEVNYFVEEAAAAGVSCDIAMSRMYPVPTVPPPRCSAFGAVYPIREPFTGSFATDAVYAAPAVAGIFHVRIQYTPSALAHDSGPCEATVTITVQ